MLVCLSRCIMMSRSFSKWDKVYISSTGNTSELSICTIDDSSMVGMPIPQRSDYIIGFITPAISPNKLKKLTRLIVPAQNIRSKIWMKNIYMASQTVTVCLTVCEAIMLFFIQTLPRLLCAGAISHVSFLGLFGPIAGVINPIM